MSNANVRLDALNQDLVVKLGIADLDRRDQVKIAIGILIRSRALDSLPPKAAQDIEEALYRWVNAIFTEAEEL